MVLRMGSCVCCFELRFIQQSLRTMAPGSWISRTKLEKSFFLRKSMIFMPAPIFGYSKLYVTPGSTLTNIWNEKNEMFENYLFWRTPWHVIIFLNFSDVLFFPLQSLRVFQAEIWSTVHRSWWTVNQVSTRRTRRVPRHPTLFFSWLFPKFITFIFLFFLPKKIFSKISQIIEISLASSRHYFVHILWHPYWSSIYAWQVFLCFFSRSCINTLMTW